MRRAIAAVLTGFVLGIAIWLSFGSLAVTATATGRRIGLLAPFWLLAVSTTASLALTWSLARLRRSLYVARWAVLILLPWLPVPVPDIFLIWTGPVVALVWIAITAGALLPLLRQVGRRAHRVLFDPRVAPRVASALALIASLAVHYKQPLPPTGDEPHYLLIAHSVVVDRDLKVSNNYQQADYATYYSGLLRPHYARPGSDGSLYSLHGPGLPVLIAPAFAIGGYRAAVFWMAAIGALGMLFVWKAAHALTSDATAAWFAWGAAALTAPVILQSALIYPDAVAGTVLSAGVLAIVTASSLSVVRAAALGAAIGLLPWLHLRFATMAAILAVVVAARLIGLPGGWRRWWSTLLGLTLPVAASVGGWLLFFGRIYGTVDPLAPFDARVPLQLGNAFTGVVGLMADQEFGLLPNAPVHAMWIGGALTLWRENKRLLAELACMTVPYVLAIAAFPDWFAASTPARYLTPLVFPLAVSLASLWARQDAFGRSLSVALLTISVVLAGAFGFGAAGTLAYNAGQGRSAVLDWLAPLVNLPEGFPSYFRAFPAGGAVRASAAQELLTPAAIWTAIWILVWRVSRRIHRRAPGTIDPAALATACVVLVLSSAVASTWALADVPHIMATRAQLALIAREHPGATPRGIQLSPLRLLTGRDVLQRLEVTTSPLETAPHGAMLALREVPPGDYRLRLRFASEPRGQINLSVGEPGLPLKTWVMSAADNTYNFHLPIRASGIAIAGDSAAVASIRSVALIPTRHIATPWAGETRARASARYGTVVIYAIDNRIIIEPDGFWVLGGRQPDVVMTSESPRPGLQLEVSNVAVANRVRVAHGAWSETRDLAPRERWLVTVPFGDSDSTKVVNFRVEQAAMEGGRLLGCHVRIVE